MAEKNDLPIPLKLISMRDVAVEEVKWLWYPYIPFGKITIVQGDGGNGKTTMISAIAADVTRGIPLPESKETLPPMNVIIQNAEDGIGDTIKPRLITLGADFNRIDFIDETDDDLTLSDSRIEQAIKQKNAKLFILDPLQAYLGADVDMHRANEVRPVFKRLSQIAAQTGCAIILVGHLNKSANNSQYRGLGSIDIFAAARSVLTVGRIKGKEYLRAFAQGKSNLAPEGMAMAFELNPDLGFRWIGEYDVSVEQLMRSNSSFGKDSLSEKAQELLKRELTGKAIPASEVISIAEKEGISEKTLRRAKAALGVISNKKENTWVWTLPDSKNEDCQHGHSQEFGHLDGHVEDEEDEDGEN